MVPRATPRQAVPIDNLVSAEPNPITTVPMREACPAWGCNNMGPIVGAPGNTNGVAQPAPVNPYSPYKVANPYPIPTSPAPSPTVAVSAAQTSTSLTTPGTALTTTGSSAPAGWAPNTPMSVGQSFIDAEGNIQEVTTAGVTGSNVPAFNENPGGTTGDNSVQWTNQGASSGTSGIESWLTEQTIVTGFPNWGILAAAAVAVFTFSGKSGRR